MPQLQLLFGLLRRMNPYCKYCDRLLRDHMRNEYGYILVKVENGLDFEHILVAQKKIGRRLNPNESVHHLNHLRADNRPQNLAVMLNDDDHSYIHKHDKKVKKK